ITPSATLPSSSTLTLVSATEAPTALARAFSAKRPKPPPPGGSCPVQCSALRSDGVSTVRVPSIIRLVRLAAVPSKASLSGALARRALKPERSPESAARKSLIETLPSTRGPRQRQIDVVERFLGLTDRVFIRQRAVLDADFRERQLIVGAGLHGLRDPADKGRPVAVAVDIANHADMRPQHHHVCDFETLQQ